MRMKNKILGRIGLTALICAMAFGLTYITRASLPGAETFIHEPCAIEDCRSGIKPTGFPFRAYEITRFEGLNCNAHTTHDYCQTEVLKRPHFLFFNFAIYAGVLTVVFVAACKFGLKT